MPYLKLVEHKPKSNWRNKKKNYNTSSRKLRQRLYSDKKWIELRHYQRVKAPVCEICGKAFAEHSHHIISPFIDNRINWNLALDIDNLMSLCSSCHGKLHYEGKEEDYHYLYYDRKKKRRIEETEKSEEIDIQNKITENDK